SNLPLNHAIPGPVFASNSDMLVGTLAGLVVFSTGMVPAGNSRGTICHQNLVYLSGLITESGDHSKAAVLNAYREILSKLSTQRLEFLLKVNPFRLPD